jgi:hypothetical protein
MSDRQTPSPQPLHALAALVRSKNAGPFWLTIDVMFRDEDGYRRALAAGIADPAVLGQALRSMPGLILAPDIPRQRCGHGGGVSGIQGGLIGTGAAVKSFPQPAHALSYHHIAHPHFA